MAPSGRDGGRRLLRHLPEVVEAVHNWYGKEESSAVNCPEVGSGSPGGTAVWLTHGPPVSNHT